MDTSEGEGWLTSTGKEQRRKIPRARSSSPRLFTLKALGSSKARVPERSTQQPQGPELRPPAPITHRGCSIKETSMDHLQRVSVSLRHHHSDTVRKTHSQPLPKHSQETPLTVAVIAEEDAGSLRHSIQHFM
ncbi:hypothetical protein INR49_013628, partial [Caranx melampygus]